MAITAVAASKDGHHADARGATAQVSMALTAVAASKERRFRQDCRAISQVSMALTAVWLHQRQQYDIIQPWSDAYLHGANCRGCIKGRLRRDEAIRRNRCPWR